MSTPVFPLGPILNILILVVLVSIIARLVRLPYVVALVFAGLLASLFFPLSIPQFSPETFLTLLLPPVIFQAATRINLSELRKDANIVFGYAFVGTLFSALLVGFLSHFVLGFPSLEALLLGVIVSPTDPIAVISTLQKSRVSRRLTLIIEGESLFNDGVAVVMYSAIITAFASGIFDLTKVFSGMLVSILVGVVIGGLIGYVTYRIVSVLDDRFVQIILTFISMYSSYRVSTYLSGSGIISVAVAGIIIGNYVRRRIPRRNVEDLDTMWQFIAFIVTSISFILIGLDVQLSLFGQYLSTIVLSIIIVLAARAITVYGLSEFLNLRRKIVPRSWQNIVIWSGVRGAVSVMLALGLMTLPIQHAEEIAGITFGIVFFSVLFQGLSIRFLIGKLGLSEK